MAEVDLDTLVLKVRADTREALAGIDGVGRALDGPLASGAERAGAGLEQAFNRGIGAGRSGFELLRRTALAALSDIVAGAADANLGGLFGGESGLPSLFGAPGRATGGSVSPGRPFLVGERGPELFVPTSAGRVDAPVGRGPVQVTINVAAPREASAAVMRQSAAQVARAVRQALLRAE